jgi:hypothetical protein
MKTLWTNQYLADLSTDAELEISSEVPCIYVRFPMNVTLGTSIYDFTDTNITSPAQNLTGIIRITWLGYTVSPVSPIQMKNLVVPFAPGNDTVQSRPFIFLRQGYGLNKIKFYPAPNATITYDSSNLNTQDGIRANVVVSGWRIADPTGTTYRIPDYIRELLVRYYVLNKAYAKEGKGQNLDASKYYEIKYQQTLGRFKSIVENLFSSRTKFQSPMADRLFGAKPPRPVLPPDFGETY